MNDHEPLADIFESYLAFLDGEGEEPVLDAFEPALRAQISRQFAILRDGHGVLAVMPNLVDDPVFAALGFDRAGADVEVDGVKVARARKRLNLDIGEIAERMHNAGSTLSVRDLFQLERGSARLPPPDATALVAALRVSLSDIEGSDASLSPVRQFLRSEVFGQLIREWADARSADYDLATRRASSQLLAANFRGVEHVNFSTLENLLRVVLEDMASADDHHAR